MPDSKDFLNASTIIASTFVRHVELHDSLSSTNDRAKQLAATPDLATPALVAARLQTAGRGRGANTWWSADGALTFSLVLDTAAWGISQRDWPRLSLATAVAVCDAIEAGSREQGAGSENDYSAPRSLLPAPCSIKWPNDVLIDDRKVGGILLESPGGTTAAKDCLILGIGINVNNSWRDAPRELAATGTALCDVTHRPVDVESVLVHLLTALETRFKQLAANDSSLSQVWQQRCWLTGQNIAVEVDGLGCEGRCFGIAEDGALRVETAFTTERVYSGTVRLLPT